MIMMMIEGLRYGGQRSLHFEVRRMLILTVIKNLGSISWFPFLFTVVRNLPRYTLLSFTLPWVFTSLLRVPLVEVLRILRILICNSFSAVCVLGQKSGLPNFVTITMRQDPITNHGGTAPLSQGGKPWTLMCDVSSDRLSVVPLHLCVFIYVCVCEHVCVVVVSMCLCVCVYVMLVVCMNMWDCPMFNENSGCTYSICILIWCQLEALLCTMAV